MATNVLFITILALVVFSLLLFLMTVVMKNKAKLKLRMNLLRDMEKIDNLSLLPCGRTEGEDARNLDGAMNEYDHGFIPSRDNF